MSRSVEQVTADFDALTAHDFDDDNPVAKGLTRLYELCDEMLAVNHPATCAPVLFRTLERLDAVELGTPGPIVHALESWRGSYEQLLAESVQRKPVLLTIWMINRILNKNPTDANAWLGLLGSIAGHPLASADTKASAARFIERQTRIAKSDT